MFQIQPLAQRFAKPGTESAANVRETPGGVRPRVVPASVASSRLPEGAVTCRETLRRGAAQCISCATSPRRCPGVGTERPSKLRGAHRLSPGEPLTVAELLPSFNGPVLCLLRYHALAEQCPHHDLNRRCGISASCWAMRTPMCRAGRARCCSSNRLATRIPKLLTNSMCPSPPCAILHMLCDAE